MEKKQEEQPLFPLSQAEEEELRKHRANRTERTGWTSVEGLGRSKGIFYISISRWRTAYLRNLTEKQRQ